MTLLPDELSPGTCGAGWGVRPYGTVYGVATHGTTDFPHECTLDAHDPAVPHTCRCGARERFVV